MQDGKLVIPALKKILAMIILLLLLYPIAVSATGPDCAAGKHKYVERDTVEPTQDRDGEIHYECEICGYDYIKIIYAASHDWSEWEVDVPPGCATSGHRYRICTVGTEHMQEETLPPTGHDYEAEIKEPSCLEDGMKTYTCRNCGDTYKELNGDAHGHSYKDEITAEPTEFAEGTKTYTCEHCGDSYTEPVPKLEPEPDPPHSHDYEILSLKEPGCETEGKTVYRCKACGDTYTETKEASGHDFGEWVTVKNPNITEEGLRRRVCSHDASHVIDEALPKAVTLEVTPVTVATATVNFGMIGFFIISILSDIYVIRWDIKKRKELKERLREQRRHERERR